MATTQSSSTVYSLQKPHHSPTANQPFIYVEDLLALAAADARVGCRPRKTSVTKKAVRR